MKSKALKLLLGIFIFVTLSFTSKAYDYQFDANYYARKYPDVVNVVGSSPDALYNHYITSGESEGRYCSQAEETYWYEQGKVKPKSASTEVKKETSNTVTSGNTNTTAVTDNSTTTETTSVEITPVYETYIDIDITSQTVTYFENGEVKLQTPCVTGNTSLNRDTPTGTYKILVHQTNKYLVGPTWKSYVNYWMKFTYSACGLHDASWRSNFGGDIYKTNGSHGCVNLPHDAAASLYNMVDVGTIVYVH